MKHPAADPLAALKSVEWLISNGGQISLGAFGPVECAAVANDESDCLAMLQRRDGESLYQLLTRLDAAIARAWNEGEFTDEINPDC
ncbi:hypothetical protein [Thauera sinica]|uniref:Uncharacterized protein n=1 Tax=Thauera sinica TaxID=2665146 RepID=A0ABW1AV08_9RHOO|nr:hypothetical protein [Thauera sp. K11]ATE62897.1 hypothetical protein CCZ27_22780 [Thauera sp. K11]